MIHKWEELPEFMRIPDVRPYYEILRKKRAGLLLKRLFDVTASACLLVVLFPVFLLLAIAIRADSKGPVFYRQVRVTQYGRKFRIHKFRSMVNAADQKGALITADGDARITGVGRILRGKRLDELPQLIDVFRGDMSFVGARPEVPVYVRRYTPEMLATLLLPAGVTSPASIRFRDEGKVLSKAENPENAYIEKILPEKMQWNLEWLEGWSFRGDTGVLVQTVKAVCGGKDLR